jgi:hypothetical protein
MEASGSPKQRAAHYREQAAQLRKMGETASQERHRAELLLLAERYETLADATETARS